MRPAGPAVHEAVTIGVPDARRGGTVKSFAVLRESQHATEAELIAFCGTELAANEACRSIEFLDELPKTSALKILRRELRDRSVAAHKEGQ